MIPDRASATALRVAIRRAAHQILDRPPVFEDPLALRIVGADTAAGLSSDRPQLEEHHLASYLRAFLAARSRFAEDELRAAVERGVRQYVILGAGLDTFPYRNTYPVDQLNVFEVDFPATQAWKFQCLGEAGIPVPGNLRFVPVDFEDQSLTVELERAGFATGTTTFFSWLGVTMYLDKDSVRSTLRTIASVTGPGGGVVFDYARPRSTLTLLQQGIFDRLAARVSATGEPWRSFFTPAELCSDLLRLGFPQALDVGPDEINARYFDGRTDGLRVGGMAHLIVART